MEVNALLPTEAPLTTTSDDNTTAIPVPISNIDSIIRSKYIDLASSALNSTIISHSNQFFAPASALLTPTPPIHRPGHYVATGAWYDGWETRRHNPAPYDYAVVRLGAASGRVAAVEIDTRFFDGNHAPEVSVEGVFRPAGNANENNGEKGGAEKEEEGEDDDTETWDWRPILPVSECGPSTRQAWRLSGGLTRQRYTHVRLRMYPDGGIGRFRLYGRAYPAAAAAAATSSPPERAAAAAGKAQHGCKEAEIDLASALQGAVAVACSDEHFGVKSNLLLPGRGADMGDGWETRRSRGRSHVDWAIVKLAHPGVIARLVVDTAHFRGNFPRAVRVLSADFGSRRHGRKSRQAADETVAETQIAARTRALQSDGGRDDEDDEDEAEDEDELDYNLLGTSDESWTEILPETPMGPDAEHVFDRDNGQLKSGDGTCTHLKLVIIPDGGVKRLRAFGWRR